LTTKSKELSSDYIPALRR